MDNRSQIYLMLADMALCLGSLLLAHFLRYESLSDATAQKYLYGLLPWAVLVRLPVFIYFGFYHTLIRYISFYDIKMVIKGVAISSLLLICISFFFGLVIYGYSRGVFIIDWFCLTTFLVGYRALLKKLYLRFKAGAAPEVKRRVLIWGAGDAGELCLRYLQKDKETHYEVVGFIDDEPLKHNRRLNGVRVLGNRHHLELLTQIYKIQEVFLAMHNMPEVELRRALEICRDLRLEAKLFQLNAMPWPGFAAPHNPDQGDEHPSSEISPSLSIVVDHSK